MVDFFMIKKSKWYKGGIVFACTLMMGSTVATSANYVIASADSVQETQNSLISDADLNTLKNIDPDELAYEISDALQQEGVNLEEIQNEHTINKRGIKGKSAKLAAKAAIAALKKMGKKAWDKAVKAIPVVGGWLTYSKIMDILNIVSDFEGDFETGLTKELHNKFGIPKSIAGGIARAIDRKSVV